MEHDLPPLILANGMKLPAKLAEVTVDADRAKNKRWQVTFGRAEEMEKPITAEYLDCRFIKRAVRRHLPVCYFVMRRQDHEPEKG